MDANKVGKENQKAWKNLDNEFVIWRIKNRAKRTLRFFSWPKGRSRALEFKIFFNTSYLNYRLQGIFASRREYLIAGSNSVKECKSFSLIKILCNFQRSWLPLFPFPSLLSYRCTREIIAKIARLIRRCRNFLTWISSLPLPLSPTPSASHL